MLVKRAVFAGLAGLLSLACAACTPASPSTTNAAPMQPAATEIATAEMTGEPAVIEPAATPAETQTALDNDVTSSAAGVTSDAPLVANTETGTATMTDTAIIDTAEIDTAAGAASVEGGPGPGVAAETATPADRTGATTSFADADLGFQISHPAGFLVTPLTADQLAQLTPAPLVGYRIMNPEIAASDIAELEPADLEIRVYPTTDAVLEEWLVAGGLLPADGSVTPAPFAAANIQGVEVCASTMIAPGCAYFFASGANPATIYELIPATLEGEEMLRSFAIDG